jgi:ABC-2 type transport system ATP-binding protein
VAVRDLTLDIEPGEVFGLLGPNGAGKSTTLYMLAGLMRPSSGSISIFGRDLRRNFLEIAPRIGVLVERPTFYEHLTVGKNLEISCRLARKHVTIDRVLHRVDLLHAAHQKAGRLSTGLRQRLGLAQAFLTEPELLILDEPTNGLDIEQAHEMRVLLRRLADEAAVTIILSTHLMREVESLCDRVGIMNEGKLISSAKTDALISFDTANVEVLVDAPEAAARRLKEQAWVESVEAKPGRLYVRLRDKDSHHLNAFLLGAGYKITGVLPRRRTLQEYFLKALNT